MITIQDWIHKFEVGSGSRYLRSVLLILAVLGLIVAYDWHSAKNLSNPEAMDVAQVARNLAEHKGFTTLYVRPLSLHLVQKANAEDQSSGTSGDASDSSRIRSQHPDLANAPLYPLVLAGLMKVVPAAKFQPAWKQSIWNHGPFAAIYPPDFFLTLFNQGLFLISVVVLFFLARSLFDAAVAWTSAGLFLGSEMFWRFTTSGLSTSFLTLIFLALAGSLVLFEQHERETKWSRGALLTLAGMIGALVGAGALTRYSFAWFIVPVLAFVALCGGRQRVPAFGIVAGVFIVMLLPWLIRNHQLSHTFFGTAGFSIYETTPYPQFQGYRLERSLKPDFSDVGLIGFRWKLVKNARTLVLEDLPALGGTWLTAFFLVGLLVVFRKDALKRLRLFVVFCLPVLFIVQALGRTQRSVDFPGINSENLFILLVPLMIMFGVSLFFTLLDQMVFPLAALRKLAVGAFCIAGCLPMILTLLSPRGGVLAYPPYHPPTIQGVANWMQEDELTMSDIPWAVAWYGNRQAVWLTLNVQNPGSENDFYQISDHLKPIHALYLTPETLDAHFVSDWVRDKAGGWGSLVTAAILPGGELPQYFPLKKSAPGFIPEQLFLTDRERWAPPAAPESASPTK